MGDTLEECKARNRQFFEARQCEHRLEMVFLISLRVSGFVPLIALLVYGAFS